MYPSEPDLAGLRDRLDAIAAAGKGSYEGRKAKVFERKPAGLRRYSFWNCCSSCSGSGRSLAG
jgi:hypothetical protein